jgi:hypothetical protein
MPSPVFSPSTDELDEPLKSRLGTPPLFVTCQVGFCDQVLQRPQISGSNVQNNSYFRYKDAVASFFRSGEVRSGVVGVLIFNMIYSYILTSGA